MVTLTHAGFCLTLNPQAGGTVQSLSWRGQDLLRASSNSGDPLASSGFPMVPFCGRIDQARFTWDGVTHTLAKNFPPEPHAIHGLGWQNPWRVEDVTANSITLLFDHDPDGAGEVWPWAFQARQHFVLEDTGLVLVMSLTNVSKSPMPAGMGWHPYFERADAKLQAPVTAVWAADAGGISTGTAAVDRSNDLRTQRDLQAISLDHAFECPNASATIVWPQRDLALQMRSSDGLGRLVVYVPHGQDFFCVEPLSHAPDAINRSPPYSATGLRVLAPDETWEETIRLEVG